FPLPPFFKCLLLVDAPRGGAGYARRSASRPAPASRRSTRCPAHGQTTCLAASRTGPCPAAGGTPPFRCRARPERLARTRDTRCPAAPTGSDRTRAPAGHG